MVRIWVEEEGRQHIVIEGRAALVLTFIPHQNLLKYFLPWTRFYCAGDSKNKIRHGVAFEMYRNIKSLL